MFRRILRSILSPRTLNKVHLVYALSQVKTEYIPQIDKILFLALYRFAFFRNAFLKRKRQTLSLNKTSSAISSDFGFSEEELKKIEEDGISKIFHVKPEILNKIKIILNSRPLLVEGNTISKSVDFLENKNDLYGTYHYRGLTAHPELTNIFLSPEILKFVSAYLRSDSVFLDTLCWWSFPNKVKVGSNGDYYDANGQNFHFDHTHKRQIKFFIYLTDCNARTGAHCFLKKTHRKKPLAMQFKHLGLSEEQMESYIKKDENWLCIEGEAGSAFFVDPYGIHKGLEPLEGKRLMIQAMYSVDPLRNTNLSLSVNVSEQLAH